MPLNSIFETPNTVFAEQDIPTRTTEWDDLADSADTTHSKIPPVTSWGPDKKEIELETPEGLSYSA